MTASTDDHGPRVQIDDPESMNLLGLLLRGMIAAALEDERVVQRLRGRKGDFGLQAGDMAVTLRLHDARVRIIAGRAERPRAAVRGSIPALIEAAASFSGLVLNLLRGAIRIRGNPLALLMILPLIRAPKPARSRDR